MKNLKGYDFDKLEFDKMFSKGEINLDDFDKKHATGEKENWVEIIELISNPILFNNLLLKLPAPKRLQVLREVQGLSFNDIKKIGIGGSINRYFISKYSDSFNMNRSHPKLAIILDIPLTFLIVDRPIYTGMDNFNEYNFLDKANKKISGEDLAGKVLKNVGYRDITGYTMKNHIGKKGKIFFNENDFLFVRCDKHSNGIFLVEFYLHPISEINFNSFKEFASYFGGRIKEVLYTDSILRPHKKLILVGYWNDKNDPNKLNEFINNQIKYKNMILIPDMGLE